MFVKIGSSNSSYSHITGLYCGLGLLLGTLKVIYLFIYYCVLVKDLRKPVHLNGHFCSYKSVG